MLGKDLIDEFPILERDIRALPPESISLQAEVLKLAPKIRILEKEDIKKISSSDDIVLSDDDVMRDISEKYLKGMNVSFDSIFLRWNKMNAITKTPVSEDEVISEEKFDKEMIERADRESQKSSDWWRQVGSVLIRDKKIILLGYNKHFPTEHSLYINGDPRANFDAGDPQIVDLYTAQHGESAIISEAAHQGISTNGASLYITTFPCPTCAMLLARAGIQKIYYRDGYSLLDAQKILKQAGVELVRVK